MRHIYYLTSLQGEGKPNGRHISTVRSRAGIHLCRQLGRKVRAWTNMSGKVQTHYCAKKCNLKQRHGMPTYQTSNLNKSTASSAGGRGASEEAGTSSPPASSGQRPLPPAAWQQVPTSSGGLHTLCYIPLGRMQPEERIVSVNRLESKDVHWNSVYNSKTIGNSLTVQPQRIIS